MRLHAALTAFAALLLPTPAAADITARYRGADGRPVIVRVSDTGDSRTDVEHAFYLSSRGVDYLVTTKAFGFVVRLDDWISMGNEQRAAIRALEPRAEPTPVAVSETGTETVAGRAGRRYRIAPGNEPSGVLEVVIGTDADLAPLGPVLSRHFGPIITAFGGNPKVGLSLVELLGRGTLLRLGDLRLESIDNTALPQALFVLPSQPLSRSQLSAWRRDIRLRAAGLR